MTAQQLMHSPEYLPWGAPEKINRSGGDSFRIRIKNIYEPAVESQPFLIGFDPYRGAWDLMTTWQSAQQNVDVMLSVINGATNQGIWKQVAYS